MTNEIGWPIAGIPIAVGIAHKASKPEASGN